MKLRIGVDFDNTLISYDEVFRDLAAARGWVPKHFPASKDAVRARLVKDGNDLRWQRLQADAYGKHILKAKPFPGFTPWLKSALKGGHEIFLVSHKSETSHLDPSARLRDRARAWLKAQRLMTNGRPDSLRLKPGNVMFAATRDEKVAEIRRLKLDVFIDDLLSVLEHPKFPGSTLRLHFGRGTRHVPSASTWAELSRRLDALAAVGPDAARALVAVFGSAPLKVRPIPGGNNRLLIATLDDGREILVKRYLLDARDKRDRAGAEFLALNLMREARIDCVPRVFYKEPNGAFTFLSVLKGRPMHGRADRAQVLQAGRFVAKLVRLRKKTLRRHIPEAAASRRCLADYVRHIEHRLSRIQAGLSQSGSSKQARRFVSAKVLPLKDKLLRSFRAAARAQGLDLNAPLPAEQRILCPSDFGFHNTVLSPAGRVQFLDFEYFGLEDPAQLAADFTHHQAQKIAPELRTLFVGELARALPDPDAFMRRYRLVLPLVGLEWVLIVLNVLAPEQLARRRFSNPNANIHALIARRLALAEQLVRRLS